MLPMYPSPGVRFRGLLESDCVRRFGTISCTPELYVLSCLNGRSRDTQFLSQLQMKL